MRDKWEGSPTLRLLTGDGEACAFLIDRRGTAVTAAHTLDGANWVHVETSFEEALPAEVVAVDRGNDVALLRVRFPGRTARWRLGRGGPDKVGLQVVTVAFEPDTARASRAYVAREDGWEWLELSNPVEVSGSLAGWLSSEAQRIYLVSGSDLPKTGYSGAPVVDSILPSVRGVFLGASDFGSAFRAADVETVRDLWSRRNDAEFRPARVYATLPDLPRDQRRRYGEVARFARKAAMRVDEGTLPFYEEWVRENSDLVPLPVDYWYLDAKLRSLRDDAPGLLRAARGLLAGFRPSSALAYAVTAVRLDATLLPEASRLAEDAEGRIPAERNYYTDLARAEIAYSTAVLLQIGGRYEESLVVLDETLEAAEAVGEGERHQAARWMAFANTARWGEATEAARRAESLVSETVLADALSRTGEVDDAREAVRLALVHPEAALTGERAARLLGLPDLASRFREVARALALSEDEGDPVA